mgnify:FL=1
MAFLALGAQGKIPGRSEWDDVHAAEGPLSVPAHGSGDNVLAVQIVAGAGRKRSDDFPAAGVFVQFIEVLSPFLVRLEELVPFAVDRCPRVFVAVQK